MQKIIELKTGIYLLELNSDDINSLPIKKFNNILLQKGYYYYVGSAQKNLDHRIKRHIRSEKKIHWHIDYLTSNKNFKIKRIFIFPDAPKDFECELRKNIETEFSLQIPLTGFGNGDCNLCPSHLLYSIKPIDQNHFISLYQAMVLLIPSAKDTFWE